MADEVKIDKQLFHNRLSAFIAQWKQDKRSGDTVFNGANSVVICIGKSEEAQLFNKTTGFQVSLCHPPSAHVNIELTSKTHSSGFWVMSFPRPSLSLRWILCTSSPPRRKVRMLHR